jgi:hypothetical protein
MPSSAALQRSRVSLVIWRRVLPRRAGTVIIDFYFYFLLFFFEGLALALINLDLEFSGTRSTFLSLFSSSSF